MKTFLTTTLALALSGWVKAQDVPPLPPMRGEFASLGDTMRFIQDKLPGKVNYIVYVHDDIAGTDAVPTKRSVESSNVSADAGHCWISFHQHSAPGNDTVTFRHSADIDRDVVIYLKQVREIVLMQADQSLQRSNATRGHPELSVKVDPAVAMVIVRSAGGDVQPNQTAVNFQFYDETLSERVSKALQHAVMLCGGGNQDVF
jgi:hypothetical protein